VTAVPATEGRSGRRVLPRLLALQTRYPLAQLLALAVIFGYGLESIDGFATRPSIYSMLVLAALLGTAGAGQTLAVLVGGIDLSISAWIVAGATTTVELTGIHHWPSVWVFLLIGAGALIVGSIVGFVCFTFEIDPLIVTLASGAIVAGTIQGWVKGLVNGLPPDWLRHLASPAAKTLGVSFPPLVAIWALLAIAIAIFLRRTVAGRRLYATGSNRQAAELALVRTRRVWMGTFAASAFLAALTGVFLAGFAGAADNTIGDPYLWQSLTAVIVGGTVFGARGDYWRTVLGALLLIELSSVLIGHGATAADQQILFGVLILVVVAFYARTRRLGERV
jgi:ribose transport system permease protein